MKLITLVGTRPEIIKLSATLPKLDEVFEHTLVHSGQNYDHELNEIFFSDLELRSPDVYLNAAGETAAETIANTISSFDKVLEREKPDAVFVYGDTNSCLGIIAAKRRKIPVFHAEAGNRCFDQRVPEEINRKILDHTSDVNFVHSEHSRRYLLNEGLDPKVIFKSGSPMPEIFGKYSSKIDASDALSRLGLAHGEYFVLSAHREENVDSEENLRSLWQSIEHCSQVFAKKVVFSVHPRTKKRIEAFGLKSDSFLMMPPLSFTDYITLQKNAFCVLSDSGTLTEESSCLGFAGVMVRQAHERPEGMDHCVVPMAGLEKSSLERSIRVSRFVDNKPLPSDYQRSDFSDTVVGVISSYTDFINRTVWQKTGVENA